MKDLTLSILLLASFIFQCFSLNIKLVSNGPAVKGANITFTAHIMDELDKETPIKFIWWDNAQPEHKYEIIQSNKTCEWTVTYDASLYESGEYRVDVEVQRLFILWYNAGMAHLYFDITDGLNGEMKLNQNNTLMSNYVATNQSVIHNIELTKADKEYLERNTSQVITYWFINCDYYGVMPDFNYTYSSVADLTVDAIIVANHRPLPPITTTTTSTTTTTTTTTTPSPPVNVTAVSRVIRSVPTETCNLTTYIPVGRYYTYGRYRKVFGVREPINNMKVSGTNWLQRGDLLNLIVLCNGTPPFKYCIQYYRGDYNVTGKEICDDYDVVVKDVCTLSIFRYFPSGEHHTVLLILSNDLQTTRTPIAVTIYQVTPHAQLSVIIVPVMSILLAVVLIMFGVAAYVQGRNRYTVEVADFDFGASSSSNYTEHKTFIQRLREAVQTNYQVLD